jgi:hypothetical protein
VGHLEALLAERERIAAAVEKFGLVRERPLVKAGEVISLDLVANPLLRELRAIDDQIIKLLLATTGDRPAADDPFAEFDPVGSR